MILLAEAFHCCCKSLNLSFKGGGAWFVPLMVIGGCHRASKYHATFCPEYGLLTIDQSPQTAPIDDTKNCQYAA